MMNDGTSIGNGCPDVPAIHRSSRNVRLKSIIIPVMKSESQTRALMVEMIIGVHLIYRLDFLQFPDHCLTVMSIPDDGITHFFGFLN